MSEIQENVKALRARIAEAAQQSGRCPEDITLVAATKMNDAARVREAIAAGIDVAGENRVQELLDKYEQGAYEGVPLHFIGNLQTNKVKYLIGKVALIQSVDRMELLACIEKEAARQGLVQDILLEVNVSGEESKSGFTPDQALHALQLAETFPHIAVRGLMTMAPQGNLEVARECFEGLAALRDTLRSQLPSEQAAIFNELSMGMSEDWREAVCAGATMVRIGRALFSDSFESVRA